MFSHYAALAGSYQNYSHLCRFFVLELKGILKSDFFPCIIFILQ